VRYEVPYGVVDTKDEQVVSIREKPTFFYQASAGIYVLKPQVCALVEPGAPCSMPALLERLLANKEKVRAHLIRGLWMDVGRMDDFEKAREVLEIWSR
jgi:NDP-sugar pyrophosphorylase family protein